MFDNVNKFRYMIIVVMENDELKIRDGDDEAMVMLMRP